MVSVKNLIKNGKALKYLDLEKIIPKEFKEFHEQVESMAVYVRMNGSKMTVEELIDCLEMAYTATITSPYSDEFEFAFQKLKPFYQELKQAFYDNTGLRMWFYWTPAQKELQVRWAGIPNLQMKG
jgi:hypothetical protein